MPQLLAADATYSTPAQDEIELLPRYTNNARAGLYGEGRFGQALGLCGPGPIYAVPFPSGEIEEGTLAIWFRPTHHLEPSFIGGRFLSLSDGTRSLRVLSYHNRNRGRQLRVALSTPQHRAWYHLNIDLGDEYAGAFHHLVITWDSVRTRIYMDGKVAAENARAGNEERFGWVTPLDGRKTELVTGGFCCWLDELLVLDRAMPDAEVASCYGADTSWQTDSHTAFYAAFDEDLRAKARLSVNGRGCVQMRTHVGVPEAMFRQSDPRLFRVSVMNSSPNARELVLTATVKDLQRAPVFEDSTRMTLNSGQVADVQVDVSAIGRNGLFWGYFGLVEAEQVQCEETIPFAFTAGVDAARLGADQVPTGLVVHNGYNPPIYAKWGRITYEGSWASLERSPGEWTFDRLDMIVDNLVVSGRRPVVILKTPPKWRLSPKPIYHYFNPDDIEGWRDYVGRVGARYRGKVFDYMLIGEAYHKETTGSITRQEYAQMVNVTAEVMRSVDPGIRVVADMCDRDTWLEVVGAGTAGKAGGYAIHPYGMVNGAAERLIDEEVFAGINARLRDCNASPVLMNTECCAYTLMRYAVHPDGYPMTAPEFEASGNWSQWPKHHLGRGRESFVDFVTGAFRVVRLSVLSMALGCENILWWSSTAGAFGSLLYEDNTPSPMSVAFANVSGILGGATFVRRLDLGAPALKAYVFRKNESYTVAAFTDDEPATVYLEVSGQNIRVRDHYANDYPFSVFGPVLALELKPLTPLYISGIAAAPAEGKPVVGAEVLTANVFPGSTCRIKVALHNPLPGTLGGDLELKLPDGFGAVPVAHPTVATHDTVEHTYDVQIPDLASGQTRFAVAFRPGTPGLPNVSIASQVTVRRRVLVAKTETPPALDGKLNEWGDPTAFPIRIDSADQVAVGTPYTKSYIPNIDWKGPSDLSLAACLTWDDENLYLAILVQDDGIANASGRNAPGRANETGDCVELFIDARPEAEQGKPDYDHRVFHVSLVPPAPDFPASVIHVHSPSGKKPGGMPVHLVRGLALESASREDGYAMELRIPLCNLLDIEPGRILGFDIAVSDLDDPVGTVRKSHLVWGGTEQNGRDASLFARAVFVRQ